MPENVADGTDHVTVQAGQILGRRNARPEQPTPGPVDTVNVRSEGARVGRQEKEIRGGLTL
ncbi:hypothetical protein [Verrucosispora sp. NA02020]|uniref:hypothetical protein n=1 Tax=Verrucosispora sp. NA02020 TaxID=2742132 RepID=UPI001592AD33|nr:hypothetical protein [Verrucosispora sp. NA02020]QKW15405.1 hypothetical protein HUT12_23315 [Verrucosispora sp. NA02020]